MNKMFPHIPVMLKEVIDILDPKPGEVMVDGTLGAGGHSEAILERIAPDGFLISFDLDPVAIEIAAKRLERFGERVRIINDSYANVCSCLGPNSIDGFLVDLGVSSMQVDDADRGFSFRKDGPLDMRFSPKQTISAADLVNTWSEAEIGRILSVYGEERNWRKIASAICREREGKPFRTTSQLADLIEKNCGRGKEKIHPATRSFQAIRIAVNGELEAVETVLPEALKALRPGGRMVVISFHSLEDRIVKHFFKAESRDCICPSEQLVCTCGHHASLKEITKHPVLAQDGEMIENPRSRSAKLRAAVKL